MTHSPHINLKMALSAQALHRVVPPMWHIILYQAWIPVGCHQMDQPCPLLSCYILMIIMLAMGHPLQNSWSLVLLDQWVSQVWMKFHSSMRGAGWVGFSRNRDFMVALLKDLHLISLRRRTSKGSWFGFLLFLFLLWGRGRHDWVQWQCHGRLYSDFF